MMSQAKIPGKDPPRGIIGVLGVFPRHLSSGKIPQTPCKPTSGAFRGVPGTPFTVHSVVIYIFFPNIVFFMLNYPRPS